MINWVGKDVVWSISALQEKAIAKCIADLKLLTNKAQGTAGSVNASILIETARNS